MWIREPTFGSQPACNEILTAVIYFKAVSISTARIAFVVLFSLMILFGIMMVATDWKRCMGRPSSDDDPDDIFSSRFGFHLYNVRLYCAAWNRLHLRVHSDREHNLFRWIPRAPDQK